MFPKPGKITTRLRLSTTHPFLDSVRKIAALFGLSQEPEYTGQANPAFRNVRLYRTLPNSGWSPSCNGATP